MRATEAQQKTGDDEGAGPGRPGRARLWALGAIVVAAAALVAWYALRDPGRLGRPDTSAAPSTSTEVAAVQAVPHLVFRSTANDSSYGTVAMVPLDDPSGPRAYTGITCDRVSAVGEVIGCLRTIRGVTPHYEAALYDATLRETQSWPLPGLPSRTRLSSDGEMLATTSFVTGHSYASTGFSTQTMVHDLRSGAATDLEKLTLVVDGEPIAPVDRNLWGVTFVDDTVFYATAQSQALGHTWLVRGDLAAGTVTAIQDGGACPSVSPDGTRLAFKTQTSDNPVRWTPSILDLATGAVTTLTAETRSYDDQVLWLDDRTIAYGIPREDQPGVTDMWSLGLDPGDRPQLFLPEAWSLQVVR